MKYMITIIVLCAFLAGCSVSQFEVNDFESCVSAGNPVMESYPRQCNHDGITYTEVIEEPEEKPVIGGDRDEHGCLIAAGYRWCPSTEKCQRMWEEYCEEYKDEYKGKIDKIEIFSAECYKKSEKYNIKLSFRNVETLQAIFDTVYPSATLLGIGVVDAKPIEISIPPNSIKSYLYSFDRSGMETDSATIVMKEAGKEVSNEITVECKN